MGGCRGKSSVRSKRRWLVVRAGDWPGGALEGLRGEGGGGRERRRFRASPSPGGEPSRSLPALCAGGGGCGTGGDPVRGPARAQRSWTGTCGFRCERALLEAYSQIWVVWAGVSGGAIATSG